VWSQLLLLFVLLGRQEDHPRVRWKGRHEALQHDPQQESHQKVGTQAHRRQFEEVESTSKHTWNKAAFNKQRSNALIV